ncbi:hypothetical protein Taro_039573 [Colocasia esculenta]|uniref:Aminotransferase-like plant mobile domain-containing protein n=1 Tax=Colocasia esculenta TaxID=4460 RepID=A0A843WGY9_COLES|nr:hypothetical protein [Colocasia esculenta]
MLGHLFSLLHSSLRRSQSTGGFTPFLQIWGYTHFPMGHGVQTEGSQAMVPLMARWEVAPHPRVMDRHVKDVRAGLDLYPQDQVVWTPYLGEADTSHPAVAAGRPLFDRHLLLLCLGTCEPLYLELVGERGTPADGSSPRTVTGGRSTGAQSPIGEVEGSRSSNTQTSRTMRHT